MAPVGPLKVKTIVRGNTPFLISHAFLRGIHAVVATHHKHLGSLVSLVLKRSHSTCVVTMGAVFDGFQRSHPSR